MKVYYAHPMSLYETKIEKIDLLTLMNLGYEIINPSDQSVIDCCNKYKDINGNENIMNFFKNIIINCDCLAFRSFINGKIPSGVAIEIEYAKELNKPIFELPCLLTNRYLTHEETKQYLLELGYYK